MSNSSAVARFAQSKEHLPFPETGYRPDPLESETA
jgi:hypothetical protein